MKYEFQIRKILLRAFLILGFIVSADISSAQIIDLEDQLVLYLPFNGNAQDESGAGIPTIVMGPTLTEDRQGNPNNAYLFDGLDDYINLNNNNPVITSNTFSVCIWAKINGFSTSERGQNALFEQRDDQSEYLSAQSSIVLVAEFNNKTIFSLRGSVPNYIEPIDVNCIPPAFYEWHHYAITINEDNIMSFYLDANLCSTGNFIGLGDFATSIDHVDIGSHQYRGAIKGAFNGVIDDVYIYNRALNNCEIEALYSGLPTEER